MFELNKTGVIYVSGKIGSFVSFLLADTRRKVVIFYDTEDEALLTQEEVEFYTKRSTHIFPAYADKVFEKEDETRRVGFLFHLVSDEQFVGLFPYSAIGHPLARHGALSSGIQNIQVGDVTFQEDLIEFFTEGGYDNTPLVREAGEYAKRGNIIDVFPPSSDKPVRIEFLGDEILSLRLFDPLSQRSLKALNKCYLPRLKESLEDSSDTIIDYLNEQMVLVHKGLYYLTKDFPSDHNGLSLKDRWASLIRCVLNVDISGVQGEEAGISIHAQSNEDLGHLFETRKNEIFKTLSEKFAGQWSHHKHVYLFASSEHQGTRLQEIFKNYGVFFPILPHIPVRKSDREWGIVISPVRRGFRTDDIIVLTEEDIVGQKKRAIKKKWNGFDEFLSSFKDLTPGEWVVHIEHGIGVYRGILPLVINGFTKDFILIEYQEADKLYVPVEDLHLVQKFIGSERFKPKIDRLGSPLWRNVKKKVKKQIEDIAGELIEIHAARQLAQGFSYSAEDELFREMASGFPFEETEGQLKTIEEVIHDLQSTKPMDRLVCGDVGFGKTEVALRASFKVVLDNKQVAILVPTTILAQQHYKTFKDRLGDYPVTVGMLSRFKRKDEQKAIAELIKKGSIDIIIGTHRMLQKDVAFRDLGLLIIDEEQRFGVKHKERLKLMRKDVDVLTLSATPIPRTLYMATMGIKDLSVINTPPLDRLAVKTFVVQFNDAIIKKGITDELKRGGQVFFVHNYIHNIGVVFDHLTRLLPDVKIVVAHGQMDGKRLEKIMFDFIDKKYDILLSTNIIESGLDISNVNTIFINNAHKMGLADLYQLRGRVGRSEKQAYAYLLVPKQESLTKDALLRLKIIEEMTELGSGFHIANYDLEIRGAGNLLGKEQSGNINLIGFELYCDMLEEAVQNLRNEPEVGQVESVAELNVPIDAFIPDYYIPDSSQKLLMYKRLSKVRNEEELHDIREECSDRYGSAPKPLLHLFDIISLKCFLTDLKIRKLDCSGKHLAIHITDKTPLNMERVLKRATATQEGLKLMPDGRIILKTEKKAEDLIYFLRNLLMEITIRDIKQ
ncbi:MAG TPA: transcription-repair coupling factor [Syntrophorhabdaceae bacterium]|nr:transcription-repair coupling factor [Syntrophorhabdaceae bacterium]